MRTHCNLFILLLFLAMLLPRAVSAEVPVREAYVSSGIRLNVTSYSYSYEVLNDNDTVLVVTVCSIDSSDSDRVVTSVMYGGSNLTKVEDNNYTGGAVYTSVWVMVDPPVGTDTISIHFAGLVNGSGSYAMSYNKVKQSDPVAVTGGSTVHSSTVATNIEPLNDDSMIIDVAMQSGNSGLVNSNTGQTLISRNGLYNVSCGVSEKQWDASLTSMGWYLGGSADWSHSVIVLNGTQTIPTSTELVVDNMGISRSIYYIVAILPFIFIGRLIAFT